MTDIGNGSAPRGARAFFERIGRGYLPRARAGSRPVPLLLDLGEALTRSAGAERVEVRRTGDSQGLLFLARSPTSQPGEPDLAVQGRDVEVRLWSPAPEAEQLLRAARSLADLVPKTGWRSDGESAISGPTLFPGPPSLDAAFVECLDEARRLAPGDVPILLRGESGTGKELLARFLHSRSRRSGGPFVALNCAALPDELLEAELFGVERGAATGVAARPGRFEQAHGGTLFLDEIGDMAPATQAKILRALQEGEVRRLGSSRTRAAEVRILSATHRDLDDLRDSGQFRSDLFYRIAGSIVELPPLRQRPADILHLAVFLLDRELARLGRETAGFAPEALPVLLERTWPGNVRQLERTMSRIALELEPGEQVRPDHLARNRREIERRRRQTGALAEAVEAAEREALEDAMAATSRDVEAAAALLGVGRSTLYRRLGELGLR